MGINKITPVITDEEKLKCIADLAYKAASLKYNAISTSGYSVSGTTFGTPWNGEHDAEQRQKILKLSAEFEAYNQMRFQLKDEHMGFIIIIKSYSKVRVSERVRLYVETRKQLHSTVDPASENVFKTILETRFERFAGGTKPILKEIVRYCIEEANWDPAHSSWKLLYQGKLYGMPNMEHYFQNRNYWRMRL